MAEIELLAGEKQDRESWKALQACNDFLRMGPGRSIAELHRVYAEYGSKTEKKVQKPPTSSIKTLQGWSLKYKWPERAALFDATFEKEKTQEFIDTMQEGLALPCKRVAALKELYAKMAKAVERVVVDREGNVVIDTQGLPVKRIDTNVVAQMRGTLSDLAEETGGRIKRSALTTTDGQDVLKPVNVINVHTATKGNDGLLQSE